MKMHVKRSSLEKYFLFLYQEVKKIFFWTFPGRKMTKPFSYFSWLHSNLGLYYLQKFAFVLEGNFKKMNY